MERFRRLFRRMAPYRARMAAAGLALLALWEIGVLAAARASTPADEDWRRAAEAVRAEFQEGDLIVFAPRWIDPVGRRWLGDRISVDDAARMDTARYGRIWEVSVRGAAAPEIRGLVPAAEARFGRVRVRRFVKDAAQVVWDLRPRSRVYEVDFQPRKCTLLRVVRADEPARLPLGQVTLGTTLQVNAGLADFRSRKENEAAVDVRVLVDGAEVATARVDNDSGWVALPVVSTTPGPHDLALEARVTDDTATARRRLDVCVAAEARR